MGTLVLAGATSGSSTLTPVDAVTAVITLPSATATLATLGANTFVGNQAITGTLSTTSTAVIGSSTNGSIQINNAGGNNGASLWFSGASVASANKNWLINSGDFAGSVLSFAIANSAGGVIGSGATEVGRFSSTGLAITGTLSASNGVSQNVIQRVQGVLTGTFGLQTTTFTDITDLTATLAALKSTSSKVRITVNIGKFSTNIALGFTAAVRLMRGATPIGVADAAGSRMQATFGMCSVSTNGNYADGGYSFTYLDSPASTAALTYKLQMSCENGSLQVYLNRTYTDGDDGNAYSARTISSILVEEIAG
jgi:hypothetical protein